jgi:hypothetical protein
MFLLENTCFNPENLTAALVPLEAVQPLRQLTAEGRLNVIVNAKIFLN